MTDLSGAIDLTKLEEIKEKDRLNKVMGDLSDRVSWVERKMITVTDLANFKEEVKGVVRADLRPMMQEILNEELARMVSEMKEALAEELCGVIDERLEEL